MSNSIPRQPNEREKSKKQANRSDPEPSELHRGFKQLRDLIDQHFTLEELQELCFDLNVEFEHLAGKTRPLKIQNLITHLAQRHRLPDLLHWLNQQRPQVDWAIAEQADWQPIVEETLAAESPPESFAALVSERPGRMTQYLDFEIEVGSGIGREYPVAVIRSPAGEARETMRFPYDELALENRLQSLQIALLHAGGAHRQMLTSEERLVQGFGQDLFNALLTGETRSRFDVSCAEARQQGKGLRLKLRIQPPELARLPWEFLYDSRRAEYVCLSRETPIIRYLELPQPIQPLTVNPPLRILGMTVSPRGLPPLDIEREKQRVDTAVRPLQASGIVQLTWLTGSTWRDLQRAMRAGPWHIFHFIGHGGFDSQADEGFIALANKTGDAHRLLATELGRLLADHHSLRLVLLNSCEGARGSQHDIFSSSASILVRRGLPAVLAMQYTITDRAAIEFARAFYEALTDNLPVDAAVAEARKAVSLAMSYTVEWGTPVLYMRAPQGIIFKIATAPRPAPIELTETDRELEQRLEQLYTDGLGAYWVEDWDKACLCFQKILDVQPGFADTADRLAEAQRQQKLQTLYQQAQAAGTDWPAAIAALEEIVADMPDYRDATALLAAARQQKQLADLYAEARQLHDAGQWQAVVNVFGQIQAVDPDYADADELLPTAKREVAEQKRQAKLSNLYGRAVRKMNDGRWQEARQLLAQVQEMEPGFRETERLLARVEAEIEGEETERQRQEQIAKLYEQALGSARDRQWQQALESMEEIQTLDPQFADSEGIAARAQEEIERQRRLNALYSQAQVAQEAKDWPGALSALEELVAEAPDYKDAVTLLEMAKKQRRLSDLYAEAGQLHQAKQWQAVINTFAQIHTIEPQYPDPVKLLPAAEREAAALKLQAELNDLYGRAVLEMDAEHWAEARRLLVQVQRKEPGYIETERLLTEIETEIERQEEERQREELIATLYEQALGLARARQWRQVLVKMGEIQTLDPQFADPEGIAVRAQEEVMREEEDARRQSELAALYAEAVRLLKAGHYQETLEKWGEVRDRDPRYPDRQKVQAKAKKKLEALARGAPPRRGLPRWAVVAIGGFAVVAVVAVFVLRDRAPGGGASEATPTSVLVVAAVSATPSHTPASAFTRTPLTAPALSGETDYNQGVSLLYQGDYEGAVAQFDQALNRGWETAELYGNWSRACLEWRWSYEGGCSLEQACAYLTTAIELDSLNSEHWHYRAMCSRDQGNLKAAITEMSRAIELDPQDSGRYNERAGFYVGMGELDLAIADGTKAVELNPLNAQYWHNRALYYWDQGNFEASITDLSRAIELDPQDGSHYAERAGFYHTMDELDLAFADWTQAIELNPVSSHYAGRAWAYYSDQEQNLAFADITKAIQLDPQHADYWHIRGRWYFGEDNYQAALRDLNKAIEIDPPSWGYLDNYSAYLDRGATFDQLGQVTEARADYEKFLELTEGNPDYAEWRADAQQWLTEHPE